MEGFIFMVRWTSLKCMVILFWTVCLSMHARRVARYWFDNRPVQIKDNQLIFDKFAIYTTSKNPFTIDGKVDFRNMERPTANLNLLAENYTLLDAPRTRETSGIWKGVR